MRKSRSYPPERSSTSKPPQKTQRCQLWDSTTRFRSVCLIPTNLLQLWIFGVPRQARQMPVSARTSVSALTSYATFCPQSPSVKVQVHLRQQLNILRKVTCIKEWSQVDFFPTRPPRTDQHGTESRQLLSFLLTKTFPFFSWFNATSSISMVKDGLTQ